MEHLQSLISLLQAIIPVGVTARCAYCLCVIMTDSDDAPVFKKRLKNAVWFLICSEVIAELLQLVMSYY